MKKLTINQKKVNTYDYNKLYECTQFIYQTWENHCYTDIRSVYHKSYNKYDLCNPSDLDKYIRNYSSNPDIITQFKKFLKKIIDKLNDLTPELNQKNFINCNSEIRVIEFKISKILLEYFSSKQFQTQIYLNQIDQDTINNVYSKVCDIYKMLKINTSERKVKKYENKEEVELSQQIDFVSSMKKNCIDYFSKQLFGLKDSSQQVLRMCTSKIDTELNMNNPKELNQFLNSLNVISVAILNPVEFCKETIYRWEKEKINDISETVKSFNTGPSTSETKIYMLQDLLSKLSIITTFLKYLTNDKCKVYLDRETIITLRAVDNQLSNTIKLIEATSEIKESEHEHQRKKKKKKQQIQKEESKKLDQENNEFKVKKKDLLKQLKDKYQVTSQNDRDKICSEINGYILEYKILLYSALERTSKLANLKNKTKALIENIEDKSKNSALEKEIIIEHAALKNNLSIIGKYAEGLLEFKFKKITNDSIQEDPDTKEDLDIKKLFSAVAKSPLFELIEIGVKVGNYNRDLKSKNINFKNTEFLWLRFADYIEEENLLNQNCCEEIKSSDFCL
jgi:hypothetical protein